MQGRILLGLAIATALPAAAIGADAPRRVACPKAEQVQSQRQSTQTQQAPQSRRKDSDCKSSRSVPALVDPTPVFLL